MECLTFDRESAIVVMQDDIEAMGIKLRLKAAGQKVGKRSPTKSSGSGRKPNNSVGQPTTTTHDNLIITKETI